MQTVLLPQKMTKMCSFSQIMQKKCGSTINKSLFPSAEANVPNRGELSQRRQHHARFIISLFEGNLIHVIFRKNNRNN